MVREITYEKILKRMLDSVTAAIDKREGSIIYDALAPAAVEIQLMYIEAERILKETFADSASREYLIKRASERGILPYSATKALFKGKFNINVKVGNRFSLDDLNFIVTEKIADCEYKLECETAGKKGNSRFGSMIPIEYIEGLNKAELCELLIPGEDEESTEELRERYFQSLNSQAFGGNVADYKIKINAISGVGGVKVYAAWNGGGTVKIRMISSEFGMPSEELVREVQETIDPIASSGTGMGIAPIGHKVTVEGVKEETINMTTHITYKNGWVWEDIKPYAQSTIDEYFTELKQLWEKSENIIIRISQIETRLLAVDGILDIADTTINNITANYIVSDDRIPVRGELIG